MFGKLGDMAGMLKKAREMQENMGKAQNELAEIEVKGVSDCGNAEVVVTCDMRLTAVTIKKECVESGDSEIVAAAILSAVNNALEVAKLNAKEKMSELAGGFDIPGLTT
ncbi:MAG: YbaB/EbfC family nucleoid-associated protein [Kiritimatiellaeota bacterium]|nr:YbaB/EbfC family nucleoid-associated protein [Kiritimatiellota bacterium]